MKIVTVPHPALRKKAQEVTIVDKKLIEFAQNIQTTLKEKKNPGGVGLAAPQVDKNLRIFCTNLPDRNDVDADDDSTTVIKIFINPQIVSHTKELVFGPDDDSPTLEGCLSIPNIYAPIPRFQSIVLEYDQLVNGQLKRTSDQYHWFAARVIQHELDHLNGILFTDYALEYDLPVYSEEKRNNKLIEIDKKMIEFF